MCRSLYLRPKNIISNYWYKLQNSRQTFGLANYEKCPHVTYSHVACKQIRKVGGGVVPEVDLHLVNIKKKDKKYLLPDHLVLPWPDLHQSCVHTASPFVIQELFSDLNNNF